MSRPPSLTLSDRVTNCVRSDVISCVLRPDTRLKIGELAASHGVSPGAVREALSRLSAEGIVIAEPQKGFRVAPVSADELRDLTETRVEIERLCLRAALGTATLAWETDVVAARHRLLHTPERDADRPNTISDEWVAAHSAFHESLVAGCSNTVLLQVRRQLYARSERYRRLSVPLARAERDIAGEHEAIADAALARDAERLDRLIGDHLRRTTAIILDAFEADGTPTVLGVRASSGDAGRTSAH